MRGEVVPSRPEMSRSMAISAKIPSVMPVELIPPANSKCGGQKMTHSGFPGFTAKKFVSELRMGNMLQT